MFIQLTNPEREADIVNKYLNYLLKKLEHSWTHEGR
jgi:hypothetical protein